MQRESTAISLAKMCSVLQLHILPSVSPENNNRVKHGTYKVHLGYSRGNDGSPKVLSKCNGRAVPDGSGTDQLTDYDLYCA
jgi:hypothetical protein